MKDLKDLSQPAKEILGILAFLQSDLAVPKAIFNRAEDEIHHLWNIYHKFYLPCLSVRDRESSITDKQVVEEAVSELCKGGWVLCSAEPQPAETLQISEEMQNAVLRSMAAEEKTKLFESAALRLDVLLCHRLHTAADSSVREEFEQYARHAERLIRYYEARQDELDCPIVLCYLALTCGRYHHDKEDFVIAKSILTRAITLNEKIRSLESDDSETTDWSPDLPIDKNLAALWQTLGLVEYDLNEVDHCINSLTKSKQILEAAVVSYSLPYFARDLLEVKSQIGLVSLNKNEIEEALVTLRECYENATAMSPPLRDAQKGYFTTVLAYGLIRAGRLEEAKSTLEESLEVTCEWTGERDTSGILYDLSSVISGMNDPESAAKALAESYPILSSRKLGDHCIMGRIHAKGLMAHKRGDLSTATSSFTCLSNQVVSLATIIDCTELSKPAYMPLLRGIGKQADSKDCPFAGAIAEFIDRCPDEGIDLDKAEEEEKRLSDELMHLIHS